MKPEILFKINLMCPTTFLVFFSNWKPVKKTGTQNQALYCVKEEDPFIKRIKNNSKDA